MKSNIASWFLFVLSIVGIVFSISLMIKGSQPCSSDACLIQLLLFLGVLIFIPSIAVAILVIVRSFKNSKR